MDRNIIAAAMTTYLLKTTAAYMRVAMPQHSNARRLIRYIIHKRPHYLSNISDGRLQIGHDDGPPKGGGSMR